MRRGRPVPVVIAVLTVLAGVELSLSAQAPAARSAPPLTLLSAEGRRPLPVVLAGGQEMVALDDLAPVFDLAIREDTVARGVVVSHKGKTIVLTAGQALASVAGRLVSLPAPLVRDGRHWLVPVEFISRAVAPVYEANVDLRRGSRLVVIGDLRVPRVVARQESVGGEVRVTFEITPKTNQTVVPQQNRLLVRFDSDYLDVTLPPAAGQGLVQALQVVDPATTVALELGPSYGSFRTTVVPSDSPQGPMHLVIDVMAAGAPPQAPQPGQRPEVLPPSARATTPGIRTVAIDPGHGGEENGARGPTGVLEKDVTLSVARRLKALIESKLGLRVVLTRPGDETVSLDDRATVANSNKADVFISLHANAALRKAPKGAEVYYLSTERVTSEARGSAAPQELPVLGGGNREIEVILWEMAQTRHLAQSAAFAELIEEELSSRLKMTARPVQQAPFRVLVGANMPAVLVEMGFLSNPDEERQLVSSEYQDVVAQAIFDALVRFRSQVERGERAQRSPAVPQPPSCP
jgi:N-acetylmuramoyl-L-alanine amidase